MNYKEIKELVKKLFDENYENFTKAIISYEKSIYNEKALQYIYDRFMSNSTSSLIDESFDYYIDEFFEENGILKKEEKTDINGITEEKKDNLVNIVGNLVEDSKTIIQSTEDGKPYTVSNFSIITKDNRGNKVYKNCSAYGDKSIIPQEFKKGDFVKIFGEIKVNIGANGKEYENIKILHSKLLKPREKLQENINTRRGITASKKEIKQDDKSILNSIKHYKRDEKNIKKGKLKQEFKINTKKNDEKLSEI